MKIKLGTLKRLIREVAAEAVDGVLQPVSDEEFNAIVLSEARGMSENSEFASAGLSALLGLAIIGVSVGKAYSAARNLYDSFNNVAKTIADEKAISASSDGADVHLDALSDDDKLAGMINDLGAMRGTATAEEVREKTSMVNSYIKKRVSYASQVRASRQPRLY